MILPAVLLILISSCSFFSSSPKRKVASLEESCVKLNPESGFNLQSVCVGEHAYIMKTQTHGKIVEIDKSGMDHHKADTIFFLVEDKAGHKIRMTGRDLVLSNNKLCIQSKIHEKVCVGDKYHSITDGEKRVVLGFTLSTLSDVYVSTFTMRMKDKFIRPESPYDVSLSIKANKTGMIEGFSSCKEELLMKTENALKKCAKKQLIKNLDKVCDDYRQGNGRVLLDIDSASIETACSKEYSMFGTSTKICMAKATAECVKTKTPDYLEVLYVPNEPLVSDE